MAKKTKKRPVKKHIARKAKPAAAIKATAPLTIAYKSGAVTYTWHAGQPVTQALRDAIAKHVPPLTPGERMALQAKHNLNEQLTGSLAPAPGPEPERRKKTTVAELRGAPGSDDETPVVRSGRPDLIG